MATLKCKECNNDFEAQRNTAQFCSANCRVKFNKKGVLIDTAESLVLTEEPKVIKEKPKLVVDEKGLKEKPSDESMDAIRAVMAKCNKDFGEGTVMFLGDTPLEDLDVISTGSIGLDIALGVGGLPCGRIVEIFGLESSGKTTLALQVIANAQRKGLKCLLIDAENSFDPLYADALGINVDEMSYCQPSYGEQGLEIADRSILSGKFGVVVIDSVAALVPKAELEGEIGDNKIGLHGKLMSQACRKMVGSIAKTNTLCIFINQVRNKIGGYGNPEVVCGGMALQFYSSVRLRVSRSTTVENSVIVNGVTEGNQTTVKVIKNKVSPPFKTAVFDIIYGQGVDKVGEIIEIGSEFGIIKKSGTWFSYKDMKLGQGQKQAAGVLRDNPEMAEEIEGLIMDCIKKINEEKKKQQHKH
jgi:recombination protein RecA